MAYASRETELFRRGKDDAGRPLTGEDREQLLKPYLPAPRPTSPTSPSLKPKAAPPSKSSSSAASAYSASSLQVNKLLHKRKATPVRSWIANLLHRLLFFLIHLAFSIYIRLRQTYHALLDRTFSILYYHHRTPELIQRDVKNLQRLPHHLSVIVDLQADGALEQAGPEGLSRLITEVSELAAWCTCIGIPLLSVYERTGTLKTHMPSLHAEVRKTLSSYFPPASEPTIHLHSAPDNTSAYTPQQASSTDDTTSELDGEQQQDEKGPLYSERPHINILLLSASDGRATLVDLTKTLAEMAQRSKLNPADISPELIHAEIEESVCHEPDLLVVMAPAEGRRSHVGRSGRRKKRSKRRSSSSSARTALDSEGVAKHEFVGGGGVCLQGYPPWQVRLTEIFYVQDNAGVGYQIFLRALHRYAKAEMRFGR